MNPYYEKKETKLEMHLNPKLDFPEHLHQHIEILFTKGSCIEVTVAEERKTLSDGDIAIVFPGQIHSYRCLREGASLIVLFDPSLLETYTHTIRKFLPESAFLQAETVSSDISLAFERLMSFICTEGSRVFFRKETPFELCCAWIHVILANLIPLLTLKERKQPESMELTHRLVIYIMEHFREPLTLDFLAAQLHVNKYYLSHVFSTHFKVGFRKYLNQLRLNYALHTMKTTELSITQIWADAGFNSQRSFNRFFLETMGMTPLEYRKNL